MEGRGVKAHQPLERIYVEQMWSLIPEHQDRIRRWSPERLGSERRNRLRRLVRVAKDRSRWYRSRLAHLDPDAMTENDLKRIPPMTKDDMMENFDAIVTDRRLSRDLVETHLRAPEGSACLLNEFHVVVTGGSSGRRGIFLYDWDSLCSLALALSRFGLRIEVEGPRAFRGHRVALTGGTGPHLSATVPRLFHSPVGQTLHIPASLPSAAIIDRLNHIRPTTIIAYPSVLYAILVVRSVPQLTIAPRHVWTTGEPLLPEVRRLIEERWGCHVHNIYATAEGVSAASCGKGHGMHLNEDIAVFELVDSSGRPVAPGVLAAKMYVTNLANLVQPLIRYELTDEVALLKEVCPCGSALRRIEDIQGRLDDIFWYDGGLAVHPIALRSVLKLERNIVEYQVRQTQRGVSVSVRLEGHLDAWPLREKLASVLTELGLKQAEVDIIEGTGFEREDSGKLKRFVPLARRLEARRDELS
jgi:putative adenylate-forming enzyme